MANDYGYFGSGSTGYAHYKQSFDRNFGGSGGSGGNHNGGGNGSGCGPLLLIIVVAVGNVILDMRCLLPIKKDHRLRRGGPSSFLANSCLFVALMI